MQGLKELITFNSLYWIMKIINEDLAEFSDCAFNSLYWIRVLISMGGVYKLYSW